MWKLPPELEKYREDNRPRAMANVGGRAVSDYELDMLCFNRQPWRAQNKWQFLLRVMQGQWKELMLQETVNGVFFENYWAIRIAKEMCRSPIINLMGCGSSGKTFFATCVCYTVWKSSPYRTSVYLSTTTGEGADARAWAVVNQLYREDPHRFGKMINSTRTLVVEEADELNEDNAKFRDLRNAIKCVLIPTGNEGKNVVAAISGRKNNRVIWCCDEYSHMDMGVLQGRVNLFTNAAAGGWAQFVSCNNGPHEGSVSLIDCEPADGWSSVNKDENWRWETRAGVCLYFNGDKSPNMRVERGAKAPFPKLFDWEVRDIILKNCWNDENSPEFWTQVFGFPPSVSIADTVLTLPFLRNHKAFDVAEWAGSETKWGAGLDLGFRKDGDPCVCHFFQIGKAVNGKTVAEFEADSVVLNPSQAAKEAFEEQIAQKFLEKCRERDCHDVALDVTGDGGIMLQAIEKEARTRGWVLRVVAVSFSGTADDKVITPGEKRVAKDIYANKVSQLWAGMRVCVGNEVIRGLGERSKAVSQLCGRKFFTDEKKRFGVEKKSDFKLRLKRSPDQGDAVCLGGFLALKMGLSGAGEGTKPKWEDVLKGVGSTKVTKPQYASGHSQRTTYGGWR